MQADTHTTGHKPGHSKRSYRILLAMLAIHFAVMYAVMYAMVDSFEEVILNLNQFYMTVMMVAPTAVTMLLLMPSMYPQKRVNYALHAVSTVALVLCFILIRTQTGIGDREFLRSMIPHHSGAVLMCERASISDPEIALLCAQIVESQAREIAQMERIMQRL